MLRLLEENQIDGELQNLVEAAVAVDNESLLKQVERLVSAVDVQGQRFPFSSTRSLTGDVEVGRDSSGLPFRLDEGDLSKHLLAVGQSGSGKTTLFYNLYGSVGVPAWFFDLKRDYRHLSAEEDGLLVLPWSELRLNPLRPPKEVGPRRWAQVFSEIFCHSTSLLSGSKNYLLKQVIRLYRLYGLFDEVAAPFPSLHELQALIETDGINYVRKSADYRDTVLNRLESMNLVAGTVFDCSQGYCVEDLLERDVVFEFDGVSRDVQNFLMEILFASVYEYRLAQGMRDTGLRHLFFLDEGKQVFSVYKERQDAAGLPEVDLLTAKMREFGEGLVVGDQEASKLTDSIKANTYTKFLLPTGDWKQFEAVAGSMNLSDRQAEYAQGLGAGEAVVQVGNADPMPVSLYNYSLEKSVTDPELERLQRENWERLESTERVRPPQFELEVSGEEVEIPEDPTPIELSEIAGRFLKDVVENPFRPLTERYEGFSSSYMGNKAKTELLEAGVVFERSVRTGSGRRKLLELTDKGREYAESELALEVKQRGRGGVVHRYWQHRIKEMFDDAGWEGFIEVFDADVYLNMDWMELVVEVAMGDNPREVEHIEKHLKKGFDAVWIFCRNQEVLDGLRERLDDKGLVDDRVVFRLFRELNSVEIPQV